MAEQERESSQTPPGGVSRRGFLFMLGAALNAVAATLLVIPVISYVFSSFRRRVAS